MNEVPCQHHYMTVIGIPKGKRKEVCKNISLGYDVEEKVAVEKAREIITEDYRSTRSCFVRCVTGVTSVNDGVRFFKANLFGATKSVAQLVGGT
jgi:hypothetical protein